jgi:hypothetical protein
MTHRETEIMTEKKKKQLFWILGHCRVGIKDSTDLMPKKLIKEGREKYD